MAQVVEILIAKSPAAPMNPQEWAHAIPGRGLEGDRYAEGIGTFSPHPRKPDYEITFIQQEHVEEFARRLGKPFTTRDTRRNVVTRGVDLNSLVGREFRVGSVLIRGLRLCEPCNLLAKQTTPEVLRGLLHKGGLRAQILSEGQIRVGDTLSFAVPNHPAAANPRPVPHVGSDGSGESERACGSRSASPAAVAELGRPAAIGCPSEGDAE